MKRLSLFFLLKPPFFVHLYADEEEQRQRDKRWQRIMEEEWYLLNELSFSYRDLEEMFSYEREFFVRQKQKQIEEMEKRAKDG